MKTPLGSQQMAKAVAEYHIADRQNVMHRIYDCGKKTHNECDGFVRVPILPDGVEYLNRGCYRSAYVDINDSVVYKIMNQPSYAHQQMPNEVRRMSMLRRGTYEYVMIPRAHLYSFKLLVEGQMQCVYVTAMDFIKMDRDLEDAEFTCENWSTAASEISHHRLSQQGINVTLYDIHGGNLISIDGYGEDKFALVDAGG